MTGSIDIVQHSFAGLRLSGDTLVFMPRMPSRSAAVAFQMRYRDHVLHVELQHSRIRLSSEKGEAVPARIRVLEKEILLAVGDSRSFRLPRGGSRGETK